MYVSTLTAQTGGGRIWQGAKPPADSRTGLLIVLCTPSSLTQAQVRTVSFTTVTFDASGLYLAAATSRDLFAFNLSSNRYVRLDKAGVAGTCCVFANDGGHRRLFVGYEVGGAHGQVVQGYLLLTNCLRGVPTGCICPSI